MSTRSQGVVIFQKLLLSLGCCSAVLLLILTPNSANAGGEAIKVRHTEGSAHGFLAMLNEQGKTIAYGDLTQVPHGSLMTARVLFRFHDGSIDDETTTFTQRGAFRLINDHHIQRGPSFPKPQDVYVDAVSGNIKVISTDKNGQQKVTTDHIDLPPDVSNGLSLVLIKNLPPNEPETKLPMVVATPKPRLVNLAISSRGEETCVIAGIRRNVTHYVGKIELGGVTGVVAPLVGKQPDDLHIWVLPGTVPAVLKMQGQLYEGGPVWTIELASPIWPPPTQLKTEKAANTQPADPQAAKR